MTEDEEYLLNLEDIDGDVITLSEPWGRHEKLMLRVENDEAICGIIVDGPMAMALVGVLAPFALQFKLDEYFKVEM